MLEKREDLKVYATPEIRLICFSENVLTGLSQEPGAEDPWGENNSNGTGEFAN